MHPYHHACASVHRYGGHWSDYHAQHHWFDASKAAHADLRHRALRHHCEGVAHCVEHLNGDERVGMDHLHEDLGCAPSVSQWFQGLDWSRAPVDLAHAELSVDKLALASSQRFGLDVSVVRAVHDWFLGGVATHRAVLGWRHHAFGIFEAEEAFGLCLPETSFPTRIVAEWHVRAVIGSIPPASAWLDALPVAAWMRRGHAARAYVATAGIVESPRLVLRSA